MFAKDNGKQKHLDRFFNSEKWIEICKNFKKINPPQKRGGSENTEFLTNYIINSVGKCEIYGTYVIPDLIHFVAEWCNIEYAFKVNIIMNNINKLKELEHKDGDEFLDTITKRLQNKIKDCSTRSTYPTCSTWNKYRSISKLLLYTFIYSYSYK